tara:strand:- start:1315 stop:1989 length:675 start_codon:yes stop_codon:yes gene_type:complete
MTTRLDPETEKRWAKERTKTWLKDTYRKELGRELGDEGEKYWTADIHDRGQTQDQVLANIRRSPEYKAYQRGRDDERGIPIFPIIPGDPTIPGPGKPKPEKPKSEKPITKKPKYDYTPDPDRKYNKYWDAVDAAADTGNRMTDDYYGRFLPQMRNEVLLGINEIGAADRYHGDRYEGKPPTYTDPKELFDYYKSKTGKSDDKDNSTVKDLEKRIKELEDKYSIK